MTLCDSGNVDLFTCFENIGGDGIARIESGNIIETEFLEMLLAGKRLPS